MTASTYQRPSFRDYLHSPSTRPATVARVLNLDATHVAFFGARARRAATAVFATRLVHSAGISEQIKSGEPEWRDNPNLAAEREVFDAQVDAGERPYATARIELTFRPEATDAQRADVWALYFATFYAALER